MLIFILNVLKERPIQPPAGLKGGFSGEYSWTQTDPAKK
jgi:hypothetical protein